MTGVEPPYRVGHGYDAHRFVPDRPLILGGVHIAHDRGLHGHSDADVLTHAVIDAILGAMALGDLGAHFPSGDERWHGADSQDLLRRAVQLVAESGGHPEQLDCTLYLQAPKVAAYIDAMRRRLGESLRVPVERVSVKATTTDGLGFVGRQEGAAASAVILVAVGGTD